jgi:uroporphyrin-III C-methyltransferase/precorrin-2 dehydrogenase/sirohydrochlorin ferrochelatase
MPTKTLPGLVDAALKAGLEPKTPAVAVISATRSDERMIAATIADLPGRLAAEPLAGPIVVMIGRVFEHLQGGANEVTFAPQPGPLAMIS